MHTPEELEWRRTIVDGEPVVSDRREWRCPGCGFWSECTPWLHMRSCPEYKALQKAHEKVGVQAVLCERCGRHLPLWTKMGQKLCAECKADPTDRGGGAPVPVKPLHPLGVDAISLSPPKAP